MKKRWLLMALSLFVLVEVIYLYVGFKDLFKPYNPIPDWVIEEDKKQAQSFRDGKTQRETVMTKGMEITATAPIGKITIKAGDGFHRIYTWDNCTRDTDLYPRYERWYGSYGIYSPGPDGSWSDCNGISRGVLEEGQQHFKNIDEAMSFIREYTDPAGDRRGSSPKNAVVYRNKGLVVAWSFVPKRNQINVDVWQIMINGEMPVQLPGANDKSIIISK